jgi:hypothetical protein
VPKKGRQAEAVPNPIEETTSPAGTDRSALFLFLELQHQVETLSACEVDLVDLHPQAAPTSQFRFARIAANL